MRNAKRKMTDMEEREQRPNKRIMGDFYSTNERIHSLMIINVKITRESASDSALTASISR